MIGLLIRNRSKLSLFLTLFVIFSFALGQRYQTVPTHVWRVGVNTSYSSGHWIGVKGQKGILGQTYEIPGYGKKYFDHEYMVGDYFANPYDLYNLDTIYIDLHHTIGEVIRTFNTDVAPTHGYAELRDYSTDYFGDLPITIGGRLNEFRQLNRQATTVSVTYGASNKITWQIKVPFVRDQMEQSWTWKGYSVPGLADWIEYHTAAKADLEALFANDSLEIQGDAIVDLLEKVYDKLYTWDSNYSVLWALEGGADPIKNGVYGSAVNPFADSDSSALSLADLMEFYRPSVRQSTGIGDIDFSIQMLVHGKPGWLDPKSRKAIYAGIAIRLPMGSTLRKFNQKTMSFPEALQQSRQLPIGEGIGIGQLFFAGSHFSEFRKNPLIVDWKVQTGISLKGTLATPVDFLSGQGVHPDSILNQIGETYLYRQGYRVEGKLDARYKVMSQIDLIGGLKMAFKTRDQFWSGSSEWDSWMTHHQGYDSGQSKLQLQFGLAVHNMDPIKRIFPLLFELDFGVFAPIFIRNDYQLHGGWLSLNSYFQTW